MNKVLWEKPPQELLLCRSKLHIWKMEFNAGQVLRASLISTLSPKEVQDINKFIRPEDYHQHQITHGMKRLVLAKYLNIPPESLSFDSEKCGKPFLSPLQNSLNIKFNISHSHNLILMALTLRDNVGIDVEYHAENFSEKELGKNIFSPSEQIFFSFLEDEEERKNVFYRCWTRKEAYLKARGIGLATDLANISVDLHELPTNNWLHVVDNPEMKISWKLFSLNIGKLYTTSVVATSYQKHLFSYDAKYL